MDNPHRGSSKSSSKRRLQRRGPYLTGMGSHGSGSSHLQRSPYHLPAAYGNPIFGCFVQDLVDGMGGPGSGRSQSFLWSCPGCLPGLSTPGSGCSQSPLRWSACHYRLPGMGSHGSGSSHLQRSPYHRPAAYGKSMIGCIVQELDYEPVKTLSMSDLKGVPGLPYSVRPGTDMELRARNRRRCLAEAFRRDYIYGCNNDMDLKTCIWSCGTNTWLGKADESSGVMWVAVHGNESICVVTGNENLDMTRAADFLEWKPKLHVVKQFRETLISEVEDLADPSSESHRSFDQKIVKPYAVVSVIQGVSDGVDHKDSGLEKRAVKFLRGKIDSGSTFTFIETVQTAISALELLFSKQLAASEIQISVLPIPLQKDSTTEHWVIRDAGEHYLDVNMWPTAHSFYVKRNLETLSPWSSK